MGKSEKDVIMNIIKLNEDNIKKYNLELEKKPNSMFYLSLIEDAKEYIEKLKKRL